MYRGTTPTFTFTLPAGVDLDQADNVFVTFCKTDGQLIIEKTGADLEISENVVNVFLTQTETLSFPVGRVQVQLNWTYNSGEERACSDILSINAKKNLIDRVLL